MISIQLPSEYVRLPQTIQRRVSGIISSELNQCVRSLSAGSPIGVTGQLKGGWRYIPVSFTTTEFTAVIQNNADNAYWRLEGRPSGKQPPSSALERWVSLKFGISGKEAQRVAFLVSRKIGREGTQRGKNSPREFDPKMSDPVSGGTVDQTIKRIELRLNNLV